jgi:hypothetical protein
MAHVRVACPGCGPVDVERAVMVAQLSLPALSCSYGFTCPTCGARVQRPCSPTTVDLLLGCGIDLVVTSTSPAPATSCEAVDARATSGPEPVAAASPTGAAAGGQPALADEELTRFQRLLADDEALAAALRALAAGR